MPVRQSRLGVEPEEGLAEEWANWRILRRSYLSATALASYSTCNVRPFVERVVSEIGLDVATFAMRMGIAAHERVQGQLDVHAQPSDLSFPQAIRENGFLYAAEVPLRDERRHLRGIADIAFASQGEGYLLELKNTQGPPGPDATTRARVWPEHGVQLRLYGLMGRFLFRKRPRLGLVYLKDHAAVKDLDSLLASTDLESTLRRLYDESAIIEETEATERWMSDLVRSFRRHERRFVIPLPNHGEPQRCSGCRVKTYCPRRLDEPGSFERLPVRWLPKESAGADSPA